VPDLSDTIAAEATPPGKASLRVVRVSGALARRALGACFRPDGASPESRPRRLCLGAALCGQGTLDRALAVLFPAPGSLTGEDVAEFQLHGSPGVVRGLMDALAELGIRAALPGEFSYRAFLNGKMGLLEAEAVNTLVSAETAVQAVRLGGGEPGPKEPKLAALRESVLDLRAKWEARVDFPEDVPEGDPAEDLAGLEGTIAQLEALLETSRSRRPLREGWRLALVGPANTGKSSLFNALLERERALVSPHPGTTRDVLEEAIQVGGYPLVLLDVAGVRAPADPVEALGVARGLEAARGADGALFVYDRSRGWGEDEEAVLRALGTQPLLAVANKRDLPPAQAQRPGALAVSALTGEGLEELVRRLAAWVESQAPAPGADLLVTERQAACVAEALLGCRRARESLLAGGTEELALQGLQAAQASLESLLTGGSRDDLYDRIFSSFCIGK
jgi:tRNA modification GTPase